MRIAVFGTGGVGGYFGGRLAEAGEDVVFIARGDHLKAIQHHGLRVESPKGDFVIESAQATDNPAKTRQVDVILVGVKAWQVAEAAIEMQPMVGDSTFVVPLQNGVDAPYQLSEVLGVERVVGGLCRISALIAAPGLIRHAGIEPYIAFGELDRHTSPRCEQLRDAFERAGVWAEVPPDIQAAMWEKFVFIAAISGIGAVTRMPVGGYRSIPKTRQMLRQALQETVDVALARGVGAPADLAAKTLEMIDNLPPGATASMQRDIMEGRSSELSSQNGAVVRLGEEAGVPTPVHSYLYASLLPQEMQARGQLEK